MSFYNAEKGTVMCFQHCDRNHNIFCLSLPVKCPVCNETGLADKLLCIPLFRVPTPFSEGRSSFCSIVLKPSSGNFLHDYNSSSDLHAGITNSQGVVYEFDDGGLFINRGGWEHCVAISLRSFTTSIGTMFWDQKLSDISSQDRWTDQRYKAETNNCYTFVMEFLKTLDIFELNASLGDKTTFCRDFIIPKTIEVARYIQLYRKLLMEQTVVKRIA